MGLISATLGAVRREGRVTTFAVRNGNRYRKRQKQRMNDRYSTHIYVRSKKKVGKTTYHYSRRIA